LSIFKPLKFGLFEIVNYPQDGLKSIEMKSRIVLFICLIAGLLITGCAMTNVSDSSGGRDGSSFANAVIAFSGHAEYRWIDKNFPGSQLLTQVILKNEGKPYDIISIKTKDGAEKKIFFDVSKFYKEKQYNQTEQ
jgi:hypothetical protein